MHRAKEFLGAIEAQLGARDPRYRLGDIYANVDNDFAYIYPWDGPVDIFLTKRAIERNTDREAEWQLAHECVHLLDPNARRNAAGDFMPTNVLEEGLATWFQDELYPEFRDCHLRRYEQARDLVEPLLGHGLLPQLKRLRTEHKIKLHELTPAHLAKIPKIGRALARVLTTTFSDNAFAPNTRAAAADRLR